MFLFWPVLGLTKILLICVLPLTSAFSFLRQEPAYLLRQYTSNYWQVPMDGYVEALKSSHFTEVFVDIGIIPKVSFFQGEGLWPARLEETTLIPPGVLCVKLAREGYRISTVY